MRDEMAGKSGVVMDTGGLSPREYVERMLQPHRRLFEVTLVSRPLPTFEAPGTTRSLSGVKAEAQRREKAARKTGDGDDATGSRGASGTDDGKPGRKRTAIDRDPQDPFAPRERIAIGVAQSYGAARRAACVHYLHAVIEDLSRLSVRE
jgi:hypothetical protein